MACTRRAKTGRRGGKLRLEDLARNRSSWPRRSSGRRSVLGGAAEELVERALHDLGWWVRFKWMVQVPREVGRDEKLMRRHWAHWACRERLRPGMQRALTYFDPKRQRDLTRDLQRREEEEEEQPAAEEGVRRR